MVSTETLLSYPYWKITFTVHTDPSDKRFCAVISHNNESITFFLRNIIEPQRDYTMT